MIEQVRPSALPEWIARHQVHGLAVVLDVREAWERQTASVAADGFDLISIPMGDVPAQLEQLDPARPVACLCHHGARSQRVAAFLEHNGFAHVANVAGGIDAWSLERDPSIPRY
jgi:rhodanese-related sulfurtransferase